MTLFEDLFGREVATEEVPLVLDRAAHTAATRQLEQAQQALVLARDHGEQDLAAERAAVAAAREALAAVPVRRVTVHALSAKRWNELVGQHPPADGAKPGAMWNPATFRPAALAECVDPGEGDLLTTAQWATLEESGKVTDGELNTLFFAAVALNASAPTADVGKG